MNLLTSYHTYFRDVWPILRDMSRRGIPIDESRRLELKALIEREDLRVTAEIQAIVPEEVLSTKQKMGLKRVPKDLTGLTQITVEISKEEKCSCLKKSRETCPVCSGTGIVPVGTVLTRWAKPVEFNPNSKLQVIRFMKHLKHPVPKHQKRVDAQGEASDTTEMKELERLFIKTKHPIYPLLIQKRQLTKVEGTYVDGWTPSKDQRVHTTYTFQTATWQTSCCAGSTLVMTNAGEIAIEDLRVGARVWTHKFRTRPITAVWKYPDQVMYKLRFSDGSFLTCTAAHRLLCSDHGDTKSRPDRGNEEARPTSSGKRGMPYKSTNGAAVEHIEPHNRSHTSSAYDAFRVQSPEGTPLWEVKSGGQESSLWETRNGDANVERSDRRWVRVSDLVAEWQARICTSDCDGRGPGNEGCSKEIFGPSHRRRSKEQSHRQSSFSDQPRTYRYSLISASGFKAVSITEVECMGSLPVFDITVAEDESYQTGGVFSHNSRAPNVQNGLKHGKTPFQKALALGFNSMQRATPGKVFINFDFKSFHALTTAHDFNIPTYARLARLDIHSFVNCHFMRLPERIGLYERPDEEMAEIFSRLKKNETFKFNRDFKSKRTLLGIQFAMGYRKLYQLNREDFENEGEAKALWDLIYALFPRLRVAQNEIKEKAAEDKRLVNKYGAIRHFFDVQRFDRKVQRMVPGDQAEQAVAFLPASHAFGHVRDVLLRIRARGLDERYGLINSIHDSLLFHCPLESKEECEVEIKRIMEAPSSVLIYPGMAPGGLSVGADVASGDCLAECK